MSHEEYRTISIELLALDLTTCGRCTGTDQNLREAIDMVAGVLREAGTEVRVTKHIVTTADDAHRLKMRASPTVRIDGRDIALEFKVSRCKECGELCDCVGGVDCRVWIWRGEEYLEAPKAMIVDALLRAYAAGPSTADAADYALPDNLQRFFDAKSGRLRSTSEVANAEAECCDRTACCDSATKSECCGNASASEECTTVPAPCGCR